MDHYEKAKQAGISELREPAAARPQNVVSLMDAVRRSIAEKKRATAPPKKGRKRVADQTKMLLPIAGKNGEEVAAEPIAKSSGRRKKAE